MDIAVEGISKHYGFRFQALSAVNLHIAGGLFGITGTNEAGKTTLLRILATRILPSQGHVYVDGMSICSRQGREMLRTQLGYVPQELELYPRFTGREFLEYIGLLKGLRERGIRRREVDHLLEDLHLLDVADSKLATLSGGLQRRFAIAQAFLGDPLLIIIDDLTRGIDRHEQMNLYLFLLNRAQLRERTIIFSTQQMADIHQLCKHYAVLHRGRVGFIATRYEA